LTFINISSSLSIDNLRWKEASMAVEILCCDGGECCGDDCC